MVEKTKKIALVYDAIFPFIKGGAEKRFYEIGQLLVQQGHDVHLYGMKSWEGPSIIRFKGMTLHGICKARPLYIDSKRRSISQAVFFGLSCFRLMFEDFDVLDCCGFPYFSLFPLRLITWLRRKRLYSTWHEVWGREYWKKYLGSAGIFGYCVERMAVLLPDTILSVSPSTTHALAQKLGRINGVVTLPNGLDVRKIRNIKPHTENSDVIFVGRLLPYKHVDILIRATQRLVRTSPEIRLTVIGEGPDRKGLEALTEQLCLQKNVRFLGFIEKSDEVYAHMHASKVSALPSTREGFGIVVIEANACGLPVITVDHPHNAARDLIFHHENGAVCALSEQSLAETIEEMLKNRKHKDLYQGYAEKYNWDSLIPRLLKTYNL